MSMTRNTDPKVVFLTHSISENSQTCPRHLPRPGRQASTRMNRLFLKLKVSPQLWDEQTSREQQTLAVPPEKPRKQASSKTKCTAITVKKKKANRARNPKEVQPRGTSTVTAPADLYSFSLESLGPIHRNSQQPLTQSDCSTMLKDFKLYYSLEGLMLKLKLQYFGYLMRRTDSLEKTLMLGKIEDRRRRGRQRMRWFDGITDLMDMSLSKLRSLACSDHGVAKS